MNAQSAGKIDFGAVIIAVILIIAGIITLYDTNFYADRDSQVFPRAVAIALIGFASLTAVMEFIKPDQTAGFGTGSWWRRILLVVTMLLACLLMPKIGFLPAGAIAFAGGLITAMHDKWTIRTIMLYWGAGAVVMLLFFSVFKYLLLVPLP